MCSPFTLRFASRLKIVYKFYRNPSPARLQQIRWVTIYNAQPISDHDHNNHKHNRHPISGHKSDDINHSPGGRPSEGQVEGLNSSKIIICDQNKESLIDRRYKKNEARTSHVVELT
jgi:hypothetical protein